MHMDYGIPSMDDSTCSATLQRRCISHHHSNQSKIHKKNSQWLDSLSMCYALGMKLLNLEFDTKAASVIKAMNSKSENFKIIVEIENYQFRQPQHWKMPNLYQGCTGRPACTTTATTCPGGAPSTSWQSNPCGHPASQRWEPKAAWPWTQPARRLCWRTRIAPSNSIMSARL